MGMLDKLREKSREKFEKELEEEFENDTEGKFEELKKMMLDIYRCGCGIDDEDGYKGDINKCFQFVISPIEMPASYIKPFKEYILKDPEVKEIIDGNSSENSKKSENKDSELNIEFRKKIEKARKDNEDDYGLFIMDINSLLEIYVSKAKKEAIFNNLSEKELTDVKTFITEKEKILDNYDEDEPESFVTYLKKWYASSKNKFSYDLLCYFNAEEYISDEDKEIIEEYKTENIDSKEKSNTNDTSDISDIKTKLEKLKSLKEEGLITEEDFNKKKADLLSLL